MKTAYHYKTTSKKRSTLNEGQTLEFKPSQSSAGEKGGVHVLVLSSSVLRLTGICRRTACLAAALIVLKEHLCVAVKSNFHFKLTPSESAACLQKETLQSH